MATTTTLKDHREAQGSESLRSIEYELGPLGSATDQEERRTLSMSDLFDDVLDDDGGDDASQGSEAETMSQDSWDNRNAAPISALPSQSLPLKNGFGKFPMPTALDRNGSQGRSNAITEFSIQDFGIFQEYEALRKSERRVEWLKSFRRSDPRYKILSFFNDVAQEGADNIEREGFFPNSISPLLRAFYKASVFTVWRPTSLVAIKRMMLGEAVGKGLDIKGKSAKRGKLSGFVPFMQIYQEEHKSKVRTPTKEGRLRVFYRSRQARNAARDVLNTVWEEMIALVVEAQKMKDGTDDLNLLEKARRLEMTDASIDDIDDHAPKCYGLDLPERLFWEAYCMRQDISREPGSDYDAGRPSEPAFQDMNFSALQNPYREEDDPRAVLFQYADVDESPMCPQTLLMAYEENGRVLPVVSDFDCFLVGTRGVKYCSPLPPDQLEVSKWCVSQIESILDGQSSDENWTTRWLEVLKQSARKGFHPAMPPLGFSDPKSHSIIQHAVNCLQNEGAVRHGAECFNYYFPQELDDYFLVISDNLSGATSAWKYVNTSGLQEILRDKVDKGYTFPLNPKWILCDPGWKEIYDKLMASDRRNVQDSLNAWYPRDSGLRESIETIHKRHPKGFQITSAVQDKHTVLSYAPDGDTQRDLAEMELTKFMLLRNAKSKLKAYAYWKKLYVSRQRCSSGSISRAMSMSIADRRMTRISLFQKPGTPLISLDDDDMEAQIESLETELLSTRSSLAGEIDDLEERLKLTKMEAELRAKRIQEEADERIAKIQKEADERYHKLENETESELKVKDKEIALLKKKLKQALLVNDDSTKKASKRKSPKSSTKAGKHIADGRKSPSKLVEKSNAMETNEGDQVDAKSIDGADIDEEADPERKIPKQKWETPDLYDEDDNDSEEMAELKTIAATRERMFKKKIMRIKTNAKNCILETKADADDRITKMTGEMQRNLHLKDTEIARLLKALRQKEAKTASLLQQQAGASDRSAASTQSTQVSRFATRERSPPRPTASDIIHNRLRSDQSPPHNRLRSDQSPSRLPGASRLRRMFTNQKNNTENN